MRVLIWGIVVLFGLGASLAAVSVHGSKDERAAIRRAVRAPFADLRRRDAQRLCADFIPAVDASLALGNSSCDVQVGREFQLTGHAAAYPAAPELAPASAMRVTRISWHGDRATAVSSYPSSPGSERRWRLQRVAQRWRIATPARLDMRSDCRNHPFGVRTCVYAMSMRFAQSAAD